MASLTKRTRSPYWYICYRDPVTRKRVRKPTPFRWNDRMQTREARELVAKRAFEEKRAPRALAREQWSVWVRPFLEHQYHDREQTRHRYLIIWKNIEAFLFQMGARVPAQLDHAIIANYISQRRRDKRAPGTIVLETKLLGTVMEEAIRRGWARVNPCRRLGLSRKPVNETAEIKDVEDAIILEALRTAPEWMRVSYAIAMAQGCRFSETRVRLSDIDVDRRRILFHAKGSKVFETSLTPSLIPLIRTLKKRGATWTWDLPADAMRQTGRNWTRFFRKLGLRHLHFHCTRVTAITRAHRQGVGLAKALRFFGHKSLVHWVYLRLGAEDTTEVADALASYPSFAASSGVSPRNRSSETSDGPPAKPRPRPQSPGRRKRRRIRMPSSQSRIRAGRPSLSPAECR